MTHTLKKIFAVLVLAIFGSTILHNCEPDPDSLGEQLFAKDAVDGEETLYNLIAYNISNNDSIRSDASRLVGDQNTSGIFSTYGVLGAFTENEFGGQKASYVTQLRMPDSFDFGGSNVKVDSVVLVMKAPDYITDSVKAPGAYDKADFPVGTENVAVSIDKKTYPVRKYGKIGGSYNSMTVNVNEVTTFMDPNIQALTRSNADISTDKLLGSAVFDGTVSTISITKKSDNSSVFTSSNDFRMRLDKDYFQTKIADKAGQPELQNAANFIRYFRGLRISVNETDKYLFQFSPNDMQMIMYYKYDKTDNGTVTRPQATLNFNLGAGNVHLGQYAYNRSQTFNTVLAGINTTDGDSRLYVQGMGGPSIGVKIPQETIDKLKALYQDKKAGIVSARIRMYVDTGKTWNNKHSVYTDRKFTLLPVDNSTGVNTISDFTKDFLAGSPIYTVNQDPLYYDFVVTRTIKDIVENAQTNKLLLINLGSFIKSQSTGGYFGAKFSTRAFDMNRAVLIGSDKNSDNRIQLRVTYGTKKITQ
ncbi:DUF4270 family protein [Chryseobacterium sp.]|uniref:DUF4270 family protein n=1 Tax=Chryseobacterium sp. TaxID=1871047 RepID=UPI0025C6A843|nr:DUF4270 family protein [Chryseobacterium sp.]MBV8326280.1 DUF4270 domain-containing protein [Chryseobacterium sp.]